MYSLLFNGSFGGGALCAATMSETCMILAAATGKFPRSCPQAHNFHPSTPSQGSCRLRQARSSCRHEIGTVHHCMIVLTCISFPDKQQGQLLTHNSAGRPTRWIRSTRGLVTVSSVDRYKADALPCASLTAQGCGVIQPPSHSLGFPAQPQLPSALRVCPKRLSWLLVGHFHLLSQ